MTSKKPIKGEVRVPADVDNIWPHEFATARALAKAGNVVDFLSPENNGLKTPDILMYGARWEIKSPVAQKLSAIERNLKRASRQSTHIIFDSQRMGRLPDSSIQKELVKQLRLSKNIQHILFVDRTRKVIDINKIT